MVHVADEQQPDAPCSWKGPLTFPGITVGNIQLSSGQITLPSCDTWDRVGLVLFHNGFGGRKEYYQEFATELAEWGWAVLQYDLKCAQVPFGGPCPQLQHIVDEVEALPAVLEWARGHTAAIDAAAAGCIDWQDVVIGGHSRGAEVAARSAAAFPAFGPPAPLALDAPAGPPPCACSACEDAARPRVAAVLLVDPVAQRSVKVPLVSPRQPHFAVVGKGSCLCAPAAQGAANFLPAATPPLSSAVHVPQGGHAQFWKAPGRWQGVYDILCGTGTEDDATIRRWTGRLLSAWLLRNFPPSLGEEELADAVDDNNRWIAERVQAGDFEPWVRSR